MANKQSTKIIDYIEQNPSIQAVFSKLGVENPNTLKDSSNINYSNLSSISKYTAKMLETNDDITKIFTDIELPMQILISSIISPNDMVTTKINYDLDSLTLSEDLKTKLIDTISEHIDVNYKLESKLYTILMEAIFTKGAYIEAFIPEVVVDDVVSDKINVTMDSLDNKQSTITISQQDLGVYLTDNTSLFITSKQNKVKKKNKLASKYNTRFDFTTDDVDLELTSLFRDISNFKEEDAVYLYNAEQANRRSLGKPLVVKLTVESVIPIYSNNNYTDHIGYFVLLDENGDPITKKQLNDNNPLVYGYSSTNETINANLLKKTKLNFFGNAASPPTLDNMKTEYFHMLNQLLINKLKNEDLSDITEISENYNIYEVMFSRALAGKKTNIVFLPADLVAYYAFEYRENGTGCSKMEKLSLIYSMRAMLLFVTISAAIKNSISNTEITVTLDENDPSPEKTKEQIMSEILKSRENAFPVGILRVNEISDWINQLGYSLYFKHPKLYDLDVQRNDTNVNKIIPDEELDEKLRNMIYMSYGLTPEMVENSMSPDFATTIINNNLLFANRVKVLRTTTTELITKHIIKIIANDYELITKIEDVISGHLPEITKFLKEEKDKTRDRNINNENIKKFMLKLIVKNIKTKIAEPEMVDANAMFNGFNNYNDVLTSVIDIIFTEETFPEELLGQLGVEIYKIKEITKSTLLIKWLMKNNYLPELTDFFITKNNGNSPLDNILETYLNYLKTIKEPLVDLLKKGQKIRSKENPRIEETQSDLEDDEDELEDEVINLNDDDKNKEDKKQLEDEKDELDKEKSNLEKDLDSKNKYLDERLDRLNKNVDKMVDKTTDRDNEDELDKEKPNKKKED